MTSRAASRSFIIPFAHFLLPYHSWRNLTWQSTVGPYKKGCKGGTTIKKEEDLAPPRTQMSSRDIAQRLCDNQLRALAVYLQLRPARTFFFLPLGGYWEFHRSSHDSLRDGISTLSITPSTTSRSREFWHRLSTRTPFFSLDFHHSSYSLRNRSTQ